MRDRALITTGAIGALIAAVCCATPLLAVLFGAVGLTAWLAKADYVVIPALILSRTDCLRHLPQTSASRMTVSAICSSPIFATKSVKMSNIPKSDKSIFER